MKRIGTLAVGLVLLISAAAATGNGNTVSVDINQEVSGICITEGEIDQSTFAYSSVCGNYNEVDQEIDLYAEDSSLVGPSGPWGPEYLEAQQSDMPIIGASPATFSQEAAMIGNVTGSDNEVEQHIDLDSSKNCMTLGAFHGLGQTVFMGSFQEAEVVGCENKVEQDTYTDLDCNSITMAHLGQTSELLALVEGSSNEMEQEADQEVEENCIVNQDPYVLGWLNQEIETISCVLGSENEIETETEQEACLNSLTNSVLQQSTKQAVGVTGSYNFLDEIEAKQYAYENCLVNGRVRQSIDQGASVLGCDNGMEQNIVQSSEGNSVVGGNIVQTTSVNSDL